MRYGRTAYRRPGARAAGVLRLLSVALPLALLVAPGDLRAQSPFRSFGLIGVGDGGRVSAALPVYGGGATSCGSYNGGQSLGAALGAELHIPARNAEWLGLRTALLPFLRSQELATSLQSIIALDPATGTTVVSIPRGARYRALETGARWDVVVTADVAGFRLGLGPWAEYRIALRSEAIDTIIDPVFRFPGGARAIPLSGSSQPAARPFDGGVVASIEYRGGPGWKIAPRVELRTSLTSERGDVEWHTTTLGAGLALRLFEIPFDQPSEPPPPVDTAAAPPAALPPLSPAVPPAVPPVPRPPVVSLELHGLDSAGHRLPTGIVRVWETRRREIAALDPWYDLGGGATFRKLTEREAAAFVPDSLAAADQEKIAAGRVNVIGYRLRATPSGRLRLRGPRGERRWQEEARSIRSYLRDRWGIDENRVVIETVASRLWQGNTRSLELAVVPASILAPLATERLERSIDPPPVSLDPVFSADAGTAGWEVTIQHDGRMLQRISNTDRERRLLRWSIPAGDTLPAPLEATLRVRDSAGRSAEATARLPLRIDRLERSVVRRRSADGEEMTATLFPGAGDATGDAEGDGPDMRTMTALRELAAAAGSSGSITIRPSDGSLDALARARRIASALGSLASPRSILIDAVPTSAGQIEITVKRSKN